MTSDPLDNVLQHLRVKSHRGDKAECYCPAHEDRKPSLSVTRGKEQPVIMTCRAGCSTVAVLKAIGLSMADLMGDTEHVAAVYTYTDAVGQPLYQVERWVPKTFRPRLLDGRYTRPRPAEEVLYRLPDVLKAKANGEPVYLAEGERDCETAREFGLVATTAMSGASQPWLPQFSEALAGADVVVVADNDVGGRKRARRIQEEIEPYARTARVVVARYGNDITDHLLAGYAPGLLDPLPAETGLTRYTFANVVAQPMTWVWENWIPAGMFTLIEGDPGEGKSALTADLAARWSTGMPMPDGSPNPLGRPVKVGMVSSEDDPARVIKPRLIVAGANPSNVVYVAGVPDLTNLVRNLDLEIDVEAIRDAIVADKLRVLLLDPLMAYLGSTRTNIDNEVRRVLSPLRYIAEETDCAIVAVRHLRKAGGKAVHAGGGSIAFTGQARSVVVVGRNPHDNEQRVLAPTKSNVAEMPKSLVYRLINDNTGPIAAPRLVWEGESDLTAVDLIDTMSLASTEVRAEVAEEVVRLLSAEQLEFEPLRRRVLRAGVECSEKMLRSVLKIVAQQERRGFGADYKVVYRLRSDATENVEPLLGMEPSAEPEAVRFGTGHLYNPVPNLAPDPSEEGGNTAKATDAPVSPENLDLAVACTVCQATDDLIYFEELTAWRCRHHTPLTYGA